MKLAVFSDVHANLPALEAVLKDLGREGYDAAFHLGDAVGIGPFPAETIETLAEVPRLHCLMGNHDAWLAKGLHKGAPAWLAEHCRWTRARLGGGHLGIVSQWPFLAEHEFEGVRAAFVHYALSPGGGGIQLETAEAVAQDMDALFPRHTAGIVFHGHRHKPSDVKGRVRYVNPGALGCWHKSAARYAVAVLQKGRVSIRHKAVPYDDAPLRAAYAERGMPDAGKITSAYLGW